MQSNNYHSITYFKYVAFLLLGLMAVFLCQAFSKDWVNYQWLFSVDASKSWTQMFAEFSFFKEPAYFFLTKSGGELIGFSLFMGIITVLSLIVKLHYLSKIINAVGVVCFFYFCLYFFLLDTTVLRVAYATALVIPAFYYLQIKRFYLSVFLIVLASQIHLTAIVFLAIYPLYWLRQLNVMVLVVFLLSPLFILMNFSMFEWLINLSGVFTDKYQFYSQDVLLQQQNSTGLYFYFVAFYYVLVAGLYIYLRDEIKSDPFKQVMASLAMLGVIAMCLLHDIVAVGARLGELLLISSVLLLSWSYIKLIAAGNKWAVYCIAVVFTAYAFARFMYLFPSLIFS